MLRISHTIWRLVVKNKIGFVVGIAYSILSFYVFLVGLAYGASCPEMGPEVCDNPPIHVVISTSMITFFFMLPHAISWGIVFFIGAGISVLVSPIPTGTAPDFAPLQIGMAIGVTGLWAVIGGWIEQKIREWRNYGSTHKTKAQLID